MRIPVLMYHSVEPTSEDYLTVGVARFQEHMRYIKDNASVCSAEEGAKAVRQHGTIADRPVVVTFDDGFKTVLQYAAPVLDALGLTATIFPVAGMLGKDNSWDHKAYRILPHLDAGEIRSLAQAGMEIGSHTMTHQRVTKLDDGVLDWELSEADRVLAAITGYLPKVFAYPYGGEDARCSERCEARYAASFATVHSGVFDWEENFGAIRRIYVSPADDTAALARKIECYRNGVQHG